MTVWQALLLGILQGATEFLPVSSSGHLVIIPHLLGWPEPGLLIDTVMHLGTMIAVIVYLWDDLWRIALAAFNGLKQRSLVNPDARMAWFLILGTIPAAIIGFLLEDFFEQLFGMPTAAAGFLLGTAALLLLSEFIGRKERPITALSWFDAVLIGIAQTLAIAPGLSRSGSTIAAALLLGYRREDATRYSFLLSVPIILGSGAYQLLKLVLNDAGDVQFTLLGAGFIAAALTGYVAIAGLLALVRRQSLWPFAVYCGLLGTLVLTGILK